MSGKPSEEPELLRQQAARDLSDSALGAVHLRAETLVALRDLVTEAEAAIEQERTARAPAEDGWSYESHRAGELEAALARQKRAHETAVQIALDRAEEVERLKGLWEAVTQLGHAKFDADSLRRKAARFRDGGCVEYDARWVEGIADALEAKAQEGGGPTERPVTEDKLRAAIEGVLPEGNAVGCLQVWACQARHRDGKLGCANLFDAILVALGGYVDTDDWLGCAAALEAEESEPEQAARLTEETSQRLAADFLFEPKKHEPEPECQMGVDPAAPGGSQTVVMLVEPKPPCLHEAAEWRVLYQGAYSPHAPEGWWGEGHVFFGGAGADCWLCCMPLPPKPWWLLSWEETVGRLPRSFTIRRQPVGEHQGMAFAGEAGTSGWIYADDELTLRRALVAVADAEKEKDKEAKDGTNG